jgi:hypothetical protein
MPYKDRAKNAASKRAYAARLKAADPEGYKRRDVAKSLDYQKRHPDRVREANRRYKLKNPAYIMVWHAMARARKQGVLCDLKIGDITIPNYCPVLGIKLSPGRKKWSPTSPSLDRVNPALGYVKGNVRVISWRANCLKRDGSLEEFRCIVAYMEGKL